MARIRVVALGIAAAVVAHGIALAGNIRLPMSFSRAIDQAEAIVVVSITQYTADPLPTTQQAATKPALSALDQITAKSALRQAGMYRFKRVQVIKGQCESDLEIHLPLVSSESYGMTKFDLSDGQLALLLLKKDDARQWVPVEPLMPIIPLSASLDGARRAREGSEALKKPDTIDVVLTSLPDPALRLTLLCVINTVKDDRMAAAMRPYADDKDFSLRSGVLYCLALNGDLSAIPKIATLDRETEFAPTIALQFYKKPEAVEFLNPLIVDGTDFLRLNAMSALRPIADKSSIPYLMQALDQDDSQHTVAYGAYATLHRLIPSLGPALMVPDFNANRDAEIQALKQWWEWEQMKAKKAASTSTNPATQKE